MIQTSARLLRLLEHLQSRRYWPGKALAETLEIDTRTLRRDIDRLRSLGYPIEAASGVGGGYQLGIGDTLAPMTLSDDEAITIALALRVAATSISGLEETAIQLLTRLDRMLPSRVQKRASAIHAMMPPIAQCHALPDAEVLMRLAIACRDQERVQFRYQKHNGTHSLRTAEPHRLASFGPRWYLLAWDCERQDWRTYRADRITEALGTAHAFKSKTPPQDVSAYIQNAVFYSTDEFNIQLIFKGTLAEWSEKIPNWCGTPTIKDQHHVQLTLSGNSIAGLLSQLMMIPGEFEVSGNEETLRELNLRLRQLEAAIPFQSR